MGRTFLSLVYADRGAWKKKLKIDTLPSRHYEKTLAKLGAKSDKLLKKPNRHAIAIRRVAVGFNLLLWLRIDILQLGKKQECSPPLVAHQVFGRIPRHRESQTTLLHDLGPRDKQGALSRNTRKSSPFNWTPDSIS